MLTHKTAAKIIELYYRKQARAGWYWRHDEHLRTFERWVWDRYDYTVGTILFHYDDNPNKCRIDRLVKYGDPCGPALANPVGFVYNYDRTFVSTKE